MLLLLLLLLCMIFSILYVTMLMFKQKSVSGMRMRAQKKKTTNSRNSISSSNNNKNNNKSRNVWRKSGCEKVRRWRKVEVNEECWCHNGTKEKILVFLPITAISTIHTIIIIQCYICFILLIHTHWELLTKIYMYSKCIYGFFQNHAVLRYFYLSQMTIILIHIFMYENITEYHRVLNSCQHFYTYYLFLYQRHNVQEKKNICLMHSFI